MGATWRREQGQSLITLVFALTGLIAAVSLAVDVGIVLEERRHMQTVADAAALAGAPDLPADPVLAQQRAQDWAAKNGLGIGDQLNVSVTTTYATDDTITVTSTRPVQSFFARLFHMDSIPVSATATARIGSPAGMNRFVPLAALDAIVAGLNPGDSLTLKYDSQTQTNGNTLALAFPGSSGANDFRTAINVGSTQTFCVFGQEYPGCTSTISTEPGSMVGPTHQGLQDLLQGTSPLCDTFGEVFSPDPQNPSRMLINANCNPFPPYSVTNSKRVVIVPVIDGLCNGKCDVHIIRFAMVFVNGVNCNGGQATCSVTGQFAEASFDPSTYRLGQYNGDSALKFARLVQ